MTHTNKPERQPTCADRVQASCDSTLHDIRLMLDPKLSDYVLIDDGTLDTVISVGDEWHRFDSDNFDDETPKTDQAHEQFGDDISDTMRDRFNEYALDFSYVASNTFSDQPMGYARYQISLGGPSTEIRFYCDAERKPFRVEYWYLDWFDGASVDITDHPVTELLQSELGFDDWLKDHSEFWSVEV